MSSRHIDYAIVRHLPCWHCRSDMAAVSAAALLELLRDRYSNEAGERLTDEDLAARLPITLSTLNRWKKADPQTFPAIVWMLREAGLIVDAPTLAEAAADVDETLQGFEAKREEPISQAPAPQKQERA